MVEISVYRQTPRLPMNKFVSNYPRQFRYHYEIEEFFSILANKKKQINHSFSYMFSGLPADLSGQVVVVTGGATGIGKEVTMGLTSRNATVVIGKYM